MKKASRHILCTICVFLSVFLMHGQDAGIRQTETDEMLDQYELICKDCLELKIKADTGIPVSRNEATRLIGSFVSMNNEIRAGYESMNPSQKRRFEGITRWFSTGSRPSAMDHQPVAVMTPFSTQLLDMPHDIPLPPHIGAYKVRKRRLDTYVLATSSVPDFAYGAMIGLTAGRWGGYARFKSNFTTCTSSYSCFGDGTINRGIPFWPSGNSSKSVMTASAGIMYRTNRWLCLYGGTGYGTSMLYWEDIDGKWAKVDDYSIKGITVETGLLASWKFMTFGMGVSSTAFRRVSFDLSLGFNISSCLDRIESE